MESTSTSEAPREKRRWRKRPPGLHICVDCNTPQSCFRMLDSGSQCQSCYVKKYRSAYKVPWEICADCGRNRPVASHTVRGAQCDTCWKRVERGIQLDKPILLRPKKPTEPMECVTCHEVKLVHILLAEGPQCAKCFWRAYYKDPSRFILCVWCGRRRRHGKNIAEGPLCSSCANKQCKGAVQCVDCKRMLVPAEEVESGFICKGCAKRRMPKQRCLPKQEVCGTCGRVQRVAARFEGKPWCERCDYQRRSANPACHGQCVKCEKVRFVHLNRVTGELICENCRAKDTSKYEECSGCHKVRRVNERNPDGTPLCESCYKKTRKEACIVCKKVKVVCTRKPDGPVCVGCRVKEKRAEEKAALQHSSTPPDTH